jgi:hypothetical protein
VVFNRIPTLDVPVNKLCSTIKESGYTGVKLYPLFQAFIADDPVYPTIMNETRKLG